MATTGDTHGGLISSLLTRAIPSRKTRVWVFAGAAIVSLPIVVFAALRLVIDAGNQMAWSALFAATLCGALTHASIAFGFYSQRRIPLILADVLLLVTFVLAVIAGCAFPIG